MFNNFHGISTINSVPVLFLFVLILSFYNLISGIQIHISHILFFNMITAIYIIIKSDSHEYDHLSGNAGSMQL